MFEKPIKYKQLIIKNFDGSIMNHVDFLMNIFSNNEFVNKQIVSNDIHESFNLFVKTCFEQNGFIAGGFAERVCAAILSYNIPNERNRQLISYLMARGGDIDTWFHTPEEYKNFDKQLEATNKFKEKIVSDDIKALCLAKTFILNNKYISCKFQIINRTYGTPEQVLNDFDIYNAMCYINKDGIFMPENFEQLLFAQQLHSFSHSFKTIKRLIKWQAKRESYTQITPETKNLLEANYSEIIDKCINNKLFNFGKIIKPQNLSSILLNKLFNLSPKFIVLLSQLSNNNYGYDVIENIQANLHQLSNS